MDTEESIDAVLTSAKQLYQLIVPETYDETDIREKIEELRNKLNVVEKSL